jgi:MFS family permease
LKIDVNGPTKASKSKASGWLNRTVPGIGLASLFSDWSHETATAAWHILIARALAWLGRGVRMPVRKALLAGSVTRETYGRAFGFERMMDTLGAIVGPMTAFLLLIAFHYCYPLLFAATLVPSLIAVALIAFVVKEKEREPVPHISFGQQLRMLPSAYRKFVVAVGLFGVGALLVLRLRSTKSA